MLRWVVDARGLWKPHGGRGAALASIRAIVTPRYQELEMSDLRITVRVDSSERAVDAGTTAGDLFAGDRGVVAARVNGALRDLSHVVEDGDELAPVALDSDDGR